MRPPKDGRSHVVGPDDAGYYRQLVGRRAGEEAGEDADGERPRLVAGPAEDEVADEEEDGEEASEQTGDVDDDGRMSVDKWEL